MSSNALLCMPFLDGISNEMLVISAEILKKLVRISNREDPDQTAFSEAVWSWPHCWSRSFWQVASV